MKLIKAAPITAAFLLATGATTLFVTGCEKREKTIGEKVDDALDNRSHEKAKDKAEDVSDKVKDAAEDVKDAAKDATR